MTHRTLLVDPGPALGRTLFPTDGEFARAIAAGALQGLPDEVALTLYTYELVERWRDFTQDAVVQVPLCPIAAVLACGLHAHPGRELLAMLGDHHRDVRPTNAEAVAHASERWLGGPRFHVPDYLEHLADPEATR